jgi:DNA-binding transcriptional ArsR family regulator
MGGRPPSLPVAGDGIDGTVVTSQRNVESNDSVAGLNQVEVFLRNIGLGSSAVEEKLDLLEEAGLLELVELGPEVLGVDS